jgi:hypothetical protein
MYEPQFGWIAESTDKKHLHSITFSWEQYFPLILAEKVEKITTLDPHFAEWYFQGNKNACVGASTAQLMAQINLPQLGAVRYVWWEHYCKACEIDGAQETTCARDIGTYEWAGLKVLQDHGGYRVNIGWDSEHGLDKYLWIKSADEARTVISNNLFIGIGSPWFEGFMPEKLVFKDGKYWFPDKTRWGKQVGGHAYGIYDALDSVEGFGFANTWFTHYPDKVYMKYKDLEYLYALGSEIAALVDKTFTPPPPPPPVEEITEFPVEMKFKNKIYTGKVKVQL